MTQEEFTSRVLAMQDTLYRIATTILPQLCDREDAVQSAIERALRRRASLRDDRALEKWLSRILINECYTLLRRRRYEIPTEQLPERETAPDAHPEIYRHFTALEKRYRLPMLLYYVEGYTLAETAQILRLPRGTVKSRLHRGRLILRRAIEPEEEEP